MRSWNVYVVATHAYLQWYYSHIHTRMYKTARELNIGITSNKAKGTSTTGAHFGTILPKDLGAMGKAKRIIKLSNTGRAGPARGGSIY